MESPYLVFRLTLTADHIETLAAIKILLQRYHPDIISGNLSLSEVAVQKYNHAIIILAIILKDHPDTALDVDVRDLLSISADLAYCQRSITCHTPIRAITIYRMLNDQIGMLANIIQNYLGEDS